MFQSCTALSASLPWPWVGLKINGPPKNGKGPMNQGKDPEPSNETSPPQPTRAGRTETCSELMNQAMECLSKNDVGCVMEILKKLVRNKCHDGRYSGTAEGVMELVHDLWRICSDESRCDILRSLRSLGVSRNWLMRALNINSKTFNNRLTKCNIEWEGRESKSDVVEEVIKALRKSGWDEWVMCEEMWRFVGVNINEFRRHGIEPCGWIPVQVDSVYLMGMALTDLSIRKVRARSGEYIKASLNTTNVIDAIFFPELLRAIGTPSVTLSWSNGTPKRRGRNSIVAVEYYVYLRTDEWPSYEELIEQVKMLKPEDVPRLTAGAIDGDGMIKYLFSKSMPYVIISACRTCRKKVFLDMLREALEKIEVEGKIYEEGHVARLHIYGKDAIALLEQVIPFMHHPLRQLRAELILKYHNNELTKEKFKYLYRQTMYKDKDDPKRSHALDVLTQAAPQTALYKEKLITQP